MLLMSVDNPYITVNNEKPTIGFLKFNKLIVFHLSKIEFLKYSAIRSNLPTYQHRYTMRFAPNRLQPCSRGDSAGTSAHVCF